MTANENFFALGVGLATPHPEGGWLEAWYPAVVFQPAPAERLALSRLLGDKSVSRPLTSADEKLFSQVREIVDLPDIPAEPGRRRRMLCLLTADEALADTASAYLKLHLLSLRLAVPNSLCLDNLFSVLPTLAWTNHGPLPPEEVTAMRLRQGPDDVWIHSLDKFPPMLQYVVPSGVRIANSAQIRLGAYLGEQTTVMHAGAVNFNAGSLGSSMIEGRVSQGVVLGEGSDLGGGASTMGTLSGGNTQLISVGEHSLIGANAGIGISLGQHCVVEAGLYVTAGMPVRLLTSDGTRMVKGRDLSGKDHLLFIRNGADGIIECRHNPKAPGLNPILHQSN